MMMRKSIPFLLALTLAVAVGLQFVTFGETREVSLDAPLEFALPAGAPGWLVEELPLGATEQASQAAANTLNLDDHLVRKYSRGLDNITVYIGYWGPGRMDTRMVAVHTPDRCWTENGWTCLERRHSLQLSFAGAQSKPTEYREFDIMGHREYVYYWHLVGDDVYDYGERLNTFPDPVKFTRDFFRQLSKGKPEQYFIRINSNRPLQDLHSDPLFQKIMEGVFSLGVAAPEQFDSVVEA